MNENKCTLLVRRELEHDRILEAEFLIGNGELELLKKLIAKIDWKIVPAKSLISGYIPRLGFESFDKKLSVEMRTFLIYFLSENDEELFLTKGVTDKELIEILACYFVFPEDAQDEELIGSGFEFHISDASIDDLIKVKGEFDFTKIDLNKLFINNEFKKEQKEKLEALKNREVESLQIIDSEINELQAALDLKSIERDSLFKQFCEEEAKLIKDFEDDKYAVDYSEFDENKGLEEIINDFIEFGMKQDINFTDIIISKKIFIKGNNQKKQLIKNNFGEENIKKILMMLSKGLIANNGVYGNLSGTINLKDKKIRFELVGNNGIPVMATLRII